jgi:cytochrome P450
MFLSIHPEILDRVRREHDDIFDPELDTTVKILASDPSRTNKLEFTNAVIKETLRFYPIGFTIRAAPPGVDSIVYNGQSMPIKHGAMVIPSTHSTHMDPSVWTDPQRFRPDRFCGQEAEDRHRFAWRPFERGPRACIAQDLAMDELRVMMLLVLRWLDFELLTETTNKKPRVGFMDLDERIGDLAFQMVGMEAKPSKAMRFKVRQRNRNND